MGMRGHNRECSDMENALQSRGVDLEKVLENGH